MPKEINSDLLRGNINTIILSALYSGDRYGYEIVNEIEKKSRGQFTIKQPTLYSCLKRLETQGYVTSYWGGQSNGGRRKYFSLTELGKEVFKQCQDDYEYSRTVIDKLISENKYDLGNDGGIAQDVPDSEINEVKIMSADEQPAINASADDSQNDSIGEQQLTLSDVDTSLSQPLNENDATDHQYINQTSSDSLPLNAQNHNTIPAENNIDSAELQSDDNLEQEANDAHFLTDDERYYNVTPHENESKDNEFIPYHHTEDASSTPSGGEDHTTISWFDAGIAGQSDNAKKLHDEESEDINDIFRRNFEDNSYIDDIKTDNSAANGNVSAMMDNYSDLMGDTAATKYQYEPDFSSSDYPYSDTSDNASALIEAELSPLKQPEKPDFYDYHDKQTYGDAVAAAEDELSGKSAGSNGYQDLLSGIIDKFDNNNSEITKAEIENNALELNDKVKIRAFGNIVESARELGEEVVVRVNDNKSKHQYAVKYYYKDNLLRLVTNGILFIVMLLETLVTYLICKNVVGSQGDYDVFMFVAGIIAALALPVYAGIKYYSNPDSKKRIEANIMDQFWFKLVVMVLICLLAFGLNLFIGMPLSGNITNYAVTLFIPIILSTNLPLSFLLLKLLYTSKYFLAQD